MDSPNQTSQDNKSSNYTPLTHIAEDISDVEDEIVSISSIIIRIF